MRFPRLSHLFHRRAKSDTILAMLPPDPLVVLPSRAVSTTGIDKILSSGEPSQDMFASFISAVPVSLPAGAKTAFPHNSYPPSRPTTKDQPATYVHPNPFARPHTTVISALMQRIRELEAELQRQYELNMCIPALQDALQRERAAADEAQHFNAELTTSFSALQEDLLHAQTSLLALRAQAAQALPGADDRAGVLAAENAALVAERLRHRKFIELMISAGGHKPVIDHAYQRLEAGADPEAALVNAVRESLARPESAWAAVLEPIVGPRTPEEYKAQVRCTLSARKDASNWRKRAMFWKNAAKEEGAHADTVTPSPSDIPSVIDELPDARKRAVDKLIVIRQTVTVTPDADIEDVRTSTAVKDAERYVLPTIASSVLRPMDVPGVRASVYSAVAGITSSLKEVIAERTCEFSTVAASASSHSTIAYANLPPLASETFRATHSIKSSGSQRSSLSLIPFLRSLPSFATVTGAAARGQGLPTSTSASSQSSGSSGQSRRDVISVEMPQPSSRAEESLAALPSQSSIPVLHSSALAEESANPVPTRSISDNSLRLAAPLAEDLPSMSFAVPSPRPSTMQEEGTPAAEPESPNHTFDESLVFVGLSDLEGSSASSGEPEPESGPRSRSGSGSSAASAPSRLPVPVLRKAMRRLSISRPVLVDTTNVAVFPFAAQGKARAAAQKTQGKRATRSAKQAENRRMGSWAVEVTVNGAGAGSPPRPSKIPIGQRFHQNFVGTAWRAVQKTKGTAS